MNESAPFCKFENVVKKLNVDRCVHPKVINHRMFYNHLL